MRTIFKVTVSNFLSLRDVTVRLGSLSVLVGANGTGKTNFLRIFQFLGEVARQDLPPAIDKLGGVSQIRFRHEPPVAQVKISLEGVITANASLNALDEYALTFREARIKTASSAVPRRFVDRSETIIIKRTKGRGRRITLSGRKVTVVQIQEPGMTNNDFSEKKINVQADSAGLNMIRKLGDEYGAHPVEALAQVFESLRLFEVDVDRVRLPSPNKQPSRLADNAANLASYLLWISREHPSIFEKITDDVRFVLPSFEAFRFTELGGSDSAVRLDFSERHLTGFTPLGRASYGTVRAIALFTMLNDPDPPKLTCLEEVDHGLHPHALDRLVERLREASKRTQIIVATHSPALVNRISEDELVIFERDPADGGTRIVNITPSQITTMMDSSGYGLGELWFSGLLGGGLD